MFKLLEELLEENKKSIALSKAIIDNYFRKVNDNINSPSELKKTIENLLKENATYISFCLLQIELVDISYKNITWRDVLEFKRSFGLFGDAQAEAKNLSYPFFIWNGLIYSSKLEGMFALGKVEDLG